MVHNLKKKKKIYNKGAIVKGIIGASRVYNVIQIKNRYLTREREREKYTIH